MLYMSSNYHFSTNVHTVLSQRYKKLADDEFRSETSALNAIAEVLRFPHERGNNFGDVVQDENSARAVYKILKTSGAHLLILVMSCHIHLLVVSNGVQCHVTEDVHETNQRCKSRTRTPSIRPPKSLHGFTRKESKVDLFPLLSSPYYANAPIFFITLTNVSFPR